MRQTQSRQYPSAISASPPPTKDCCPHSVKANCMNCTSFRNFDRSTASRLRTSIFRANSEVQASGREDQGRRSTFSPDCTGPNIPSVFVDFEFHTLSKLISNTADLSDRHELAIVLVDAIPDYPDPRNILLAVECKSAATFRKSIVKEALSIRRELSLLVSDAESALTDLGGHPPVSVPAKRASEFWLAYLDGVGTRYAQSSGAFGIDFTRLQP